ncbi:2-polyprenyl-6-methoxyphenol hydroxylase-like oxidoreductase [Mycobacteroides abscessus subsp. bolletii]|uniref:FAD-dependent monooxygenase n=1 Tax=Mycobacteroides abscessus TaxID=36809 RepID=UPI0009A5B5D3|nr:FAD-dependent monooxygenase [Mycobacteroides abscessus]SKG69553.1 2-polyprenyl-6-methoxyphenol hydroxylase-like oxidoreductase [Mycobacteroides abscessus subsp. bolletii]SKH12688.1 2-polyprenyl-6-methoxyphenol hydroxylase-like oxidoreductase [Mycobacteroides abscessus subsp. bolletii]
MPDSTSDVIVVGGGIGGLGVAYALSRQGLKVRVLEQASVLGEVGAGIQLAPNCTRILDDYGLLEEAKSLGVVPKAMVMRDALNSTELTRLDLEDLAIRYGFPYLVIHRSDLHDLLLRACRRAGVDLCTDRRVVGYRQTEGSVEVELADGSTATADVAIAADGLHSIARKLLVDDQPISSAYVAYRGTVPVDRNIRHDVDLSEIVVYVGPRCHFVHYGLRGGELLNQVAVFESPRALAGDESWGTPDELDAAFANTCSNVTNGLPMMWRDKCWRMFDRNPLTTWVRGRIALLGDAAHPPLQYIAQGAIMAIEDGWVLAEHVARHKSQRTVDWSSVLAAYEAVRPEHCRRVLTTSRAWGQLWHVDGLARLQRNSILRSRDTYDYSFIDWLYGPTALDPSEEPQMFQTIPLATAKIETQPGG